MAKKEVQAKKPVPGAWLLKQLLLAFVIVALLVTGAYFLLTVVTMHGEEIAVPDFSNLTEVEASELASLNNMRVEVTDSVFLKRMRR